MYCIICNVANKRIREQAQHAIEAAQAALKNTAVECEPAFTSVAELVKWLATDVNPVPSFRFDGVVLGYASDTFKDKTYDRLLYV